jgi:hypothetical protein
MSGLGGSPHGGTLRRQLTGIADFMPPSAMSGTCGRGVHGGARWRRLRYPPFFALILSSSRNARRSRAGRRGRGGRRRREPCGGAGARGSAAAAGGSLGLAHRGCVWAARDARVPAHVGRCNTTRSRSPLQASPTQASTASRTRTTFSSGRRPIARRSCACARGGAASGPPPQPVPPAPHPLAASPRPSRAPALFPPSRPDQRRRV